MPLIVEDGRVPTRWAERKSGYTVPPWSKTSAQDRALSLAFINNMPDAALEDTEIQFFDLLDSASGDISIYVRLYSLPGVPREERGLQHLNSFYLSFDDLWRNQFDAVIVTGTEPHYSNLSDEPYWRVLTEVLDWAERETTSAILSCLAAHAGVLYRDGINRCRLADKKFGIFDSTKLGTHRLTSSVSECVPFPHSRWNEVRDEDLSAAGYTVLTKSPTAGVDLFAKKNRRSLFVHFQGHPEYGVETLFKEYRRDIKRFLKGERETYPAMPHGYFGASSSQAFTSFRERATSCKSKDVMAWFPEGVTKDLRNLWRSAALCIYREWLHFLLSEKATLSQFAAVPALYGDIPTKRPTAT